MVWQCGQCLNFSQYTNSSDGRSLSEIGAYIEPMQMRTHHHEESLKPDQLLLKTVWAARDSGGMDGHHGGGHQNSGDDWAV